MDKSLSPARGLFAAVFISLGILGLIYGDFAMVWQAVPEHLPGRTGIAYYVAALELLLGLGLLFRETLAPASILLFVFMLLWLAVCRLPHILSAPGTELSWLGFGETAVMTAGAWVLFAAVDMRRLKLASGAPGLRGARLLFGLALPMIGLSHFVYLDATVSFIPAWMPYREAWAYLTGAGDILAGVAIVCGVLPRLAATLDAAMLGIITLMVWLPGLFKPSDRLHWTAFVISTAIAAGAWLVAESYREAAWLDSRKFSFKTATE